MYLVLEVGEVWLWGVYCGCFNKMLLGWGWVFGVKLVVVVLLVLLFGLVSVLMDCSVVGEVVLGEGV